MTERPNRPPDISKVLELPSDQTIQRLAELAEAHPDEAVRLLCLVVSRLGPSVEGIAAMLPGLANGDPTFLEPDV